SGPNLASSRFANAAASASFFDERFDRSDAALLGSGFGGWASLGCCFSAVALVVGDLVVGDLASDPAVAGFVLADSVCATGLATSGLAALKAGSRVIATVSATRRSRAETQLIRAGAVTFADVLPGPTSAKFGNV